MGRLCMVSFPMVFFVGWPLGMRCAVVAQKGCAKKGVNEGK